MSDLPVSGERHERAVEAAVKECARLLQDDVDGNDAAKEAIDAYFASLAEQGVRLIERPVCPDCKGWGGPLRDPRDSDPPGLLRAAGDPSCPRCGGSGYDPMVPLAEVVEWCENYHRMNGVPPPASHLARQFRGGER